MTDTEKPDDEPAPAPLDLSDAVVSDPFTDPITFPEPVDAAEPVAEEAASTPESRRQRVHEREARKRDERRARMGRMPFGAEQPPDMQQPFGTHEGMKSPGFDSIRGADDVAGTMATYQLELVRVLRSMQQILIETISRLETLENAFDRLR